MDYDYFQLEVERPPHGVRRAALDLARLSETGQIGRKVVMFTALLGFSSNTALLLLERKEGAVPDLVRNAAGVIASEHHRLTPTLRPKAGAHPEPDGIYVHNWFTVEAHAVDEFVQLSGEAWPDFEARFDTRIFGLFLADETDDDRVQKVRRLLLMTRYADLGEWQKSRDPSTDAMAIFLRRRELTRSSLARACVIGP